MAHLIGIVALIVPPAGVRAQPSEEVEDRAAVLHRLIFDVESRRRVLVRSRGELIAISADQVGELFASQILTGGMPVDSILPRTRRVREMSDAWLQELKRELTLLQGTRGAPNDVRLQWNGAPGTWAMACEGRYPPEVHGKVDDVYMTRPPNGSRWFHASLYRGYTLVTALSGIVTETAASGQQRHVEMPGNDFPDVLTLVWDAQVSEASPAGDGVEGMIVASGALAYTGNDGSCRGRWHSP
jgi:hypothetical protein